MKNAWIDLETTGVNPYSNGIHQIAGIIEIDGVEKERFEFKVKPFPQDVIEEKVATLPKANQISLVDKEGKKIATLLVREEIVKCVPTITFRLIEVYEIFDGFAHISFAYGFNWIEIKKNHKQIDELHIYRIRKSMAYIDCFVYERISLTAFEYKYETGKNLTKVYVDTSRES